MKELKTFILHSRIDGHYVVLVMVLIFAVITQLIGVNKIRDMEQEREKIIRNYNISLRIEQEKSINYMQQITKKLEDLKK